MSGWLLRVTAWSWLVLAGTVFGAGAVGAMIPTAQLTFRADIVGQQQIRLVDVRRGLSHRLATLSDEAANAQGFDMAWSPDGVRLAILIERWFEPSWIDMWENGQRSRAVVGNRIEAPVAWSPGGSRVVFTVSVNSAGNLMSADAETGVMTPLVDLPQSVNNPIWSPSGDVAFLVREDDTSNLWLRNAAGQAAPLTGITDSATYYHSPSWSPDGTQIAFVARVDSVRNIAVIDADGGTIRRITPNSGAVSAPSWSPDGQWLAFIAFFDTRYRIMLTPVENPRPREVLLVENADAQPVQWSPDGRWLALTTRGQLQVIATDAMFDAQAPLNPRTVWGGEGIGTARHPVWRP